MTNFRMAMLVAVTAAAVAGSQALAADGTLAPGKPAGVHQAARSPSLLLIGGAAAVTVIAVVIATQSSNNAACGTACNVPTTTTTS